jgi:hypothetical protein
MSAQGKWNVTIDTPMGEKTGVLELTSDGANLSGSLYDDEHRAEISEGRDVGGELTWTVKLTRPMRLSLKFTARVDGDRIEGMARHLLGKARFHGTRL